MRDRLDELRQSMKDANEEDVGTPLAGEEANAPVFPLAVVFETEPVLENLLSEVQRIREDIDSLDAEVRRFSQQQKVLVATMRRFSVMKKESSVTRDLKLQAESLHKRLDALAQRVKTAESDSGEHAVLARILRTQHSALFLRFQGVMRGYNGSLVNKQEKCKQFIVRQLEVSGREVSEEEVDEMVAQGRWEVFNENVMHEAKVTRAQLSEIEQRHRELLSLEGNMRDLRDLFLEIYVLVEEQGQHVENIQSNVQRTQDYVADTNEKFKTAMKYKERNPLRRMCCCCCPWKKCR